MKYRKLGRTGFNVSDIAHGLWGMSGWSGSEDQESLQAMQLAIEQGSNFFDTAWAYGEGKSDGLLGEILSRNKSKRLFVASKVPPMNGRWPALPEYKYREVFPASHVINYAEKIRETVEKLKSEKLIRFFGLSINRWQPENGIAALRTGLVDTVQVIYNIIDQSPEDKLFPLCRELNVGVIARVPLDEGSLGGKMTAATKFPANDWRAKYFGPANLAKTLARVDELKKLVPPGMTLAEMSLRFILSNPDVGTTIIGMRKHAHVKENIAASDAGALDKTLLQKLKAHRWDRVPQNWSD